MQASEALRDIVSGRKHAEREGKNEGYDDNLVYSTFLGGSNADLATAVAVDGSGYAYVTGDTYSADFGLASAVQAAFGGRVDAFVTKLSSAGAVVLSTFLGGSLDEHAGGIATDGSGTVWVAGGTLSTNFPGTAGLVVGLHQQRPHRQVIGGQAGAGGHCGHGEHTQGAAQERQSDIRRPPSSRRGSRRGGAAPSARAR